MIKYSKGNKENYKAYSQAYAWYIWSVINKLGCLCEEDIKKLKNFWRKIC